MSKIIPRTTHTVENQTQQLFVCVSESFIGVILRDKATFKRLDFFELDLSDRVTALYIDDFDELLAFANANDKGCIRSPIPPSENTDNKVTTSSGVVTSEGEALSFDDYDVLIFALSCYRDFYYSRCDVDLDTVDYHFEKSEILEKKLKRLKSAINDDFPF